jgi:hypothetical protein
MTDVMTPNKGHGILIDWLMMKCKIKKKLVYCEETINFNYFKNGRLHKMYVLSTWNWKLILTFG